MPGGDNCLVLTPAQLRKLRRAPATPNRLSEALKLAGLTQERFGDAIGMTQGAVSKIAGGQPGTPIKTCQDIAAFFGCSVDDLFPAQREVTA